MQRAPTFPTELKEPDDYENEIRTLIERTKRTHGNLALELHKYADALYLDKFVESMTFDNWLCRINSLIIHHLQVMESPPDDSLFLAAQLKALELGNISAVEELHSNNMMAVSGKYKDSDLNKLVRKLGQDGVNRTLARAKEIMSRWEEDREGLALAVEEFLGVPSGLNECMAFAAKQLLLREKSIISAIDRVSRIKFTNDNRQNLMWINFVRALTKKRFLVSAAMRELIRIKRMSDEQEIRLALGQFAAMFVRARFTNKLPDELLVFLEGYEPLSPEWFYFHMQLDKCMMGTDHLPSYLDLGRQLQVQVFFENVLFARVILALRGEAAEPYKTYLPILAFDQSKSAILMAVSANYVCFDNKTEVYTRFFNQQKLDGKMTGLFFRQNLSRSIQSCANETGYRTCLPLNLIEVEMLSSSKKIQAVEDGWFMDLSEPGPKMQRMKTGRRSRKKKGTRKTPSPSSQSLAVAEAESDSSSSASVTEDEMENEDPVIPRDQDLEKPHKIENQEGLEYEIEEYLAEHQAEVADFQAMKSMKKYEFDALRDASKSLAVAEPPKHLSTKKNKVIFFSTDDFLALHPEAANLYQLNIYSELANVALAQPKIRLQWVFSKHVVIGHDTFIFLCQVFNLVEGRSKLTFENFVKSVDELTAPVTVGKTQAKVKRSRTVFRFNHAFIINGETCLPPIGGVHREHASSRFNYKQVKKFLMHGGAHPYFFKVIE